MNSNLISTSHPDILVVDDNPENLRLLAKMLGDAGYKIRKAINGNLALKAVEGAKPDLILLDINMPEMNGYTVCERLKASPDSADIPVIFISALDEVIDKVKAFEVGGVDYITKPFELQEMLVRVKNHLTLYWQKKQLTEQKKQLELTLGELQRTQAQLIQAEKMSSLGRMVAGVAHELNNPVSFIYGNIDLARSYFQNLLRLVKTYQHTCSPTPPELQELASEIELDFLVEDWSKLMDSMQVGAERIRQIVLSLKNFARLDEKELKLVDIHEGIDSALLLLQHQLKSVGVNGVERDSVLRPEIQVIKNYGQLPKVTCYASQLNQVFMNLLSNAIDALEDVHSSWFTVHDSSCLEPSSKAQPSMNNESLPTLVICTEFRPGKVLNYSTVIIRIADNGIGINENLQKRIFDPFFTTKPVGSGMGLGLSISYHIVVEKHKGKISCVSTPGKGTEFIVEIPISL